MKKMKYAAAPLVMIVLILGGCSFFKNGDPKPRLSMCIGVDISGSFMNSPYYDDSIGFLAKYIYSHMHGLGGMEVPNALFLSSIGGARANEPKTFFPKQTFENKSVKEIEAKLSKIFPREKSNPFTDYNAFFEQIALTVKNKNLVLRPITVVMVSDGIPDLSSPGGNDYKSIVVNPLERLARSVTVRLLYTSPTVGRNWQTKVKRRRVKVWTQDAEVMVSWKDPQIYLRGRPLEKQDRYFAWIKDNVDFGVRARRVD